jgi:hypothetical protein
MKKKLWKKTNIVADVGDCRYCGLNIISTDSFVSFYSGDHSHYDCMKKDDELRQQVLKKIEQNINQTMETHEKRLSQN